MHPVYDPSVSRVEKQSQWKKIILAWEGSDLTAKGYCQQEQIKERDLKRWSYRLKKQQKILSSSLLKPAMPFVPLELVRNISDEIESGQDGIELLFKHYRIRVGSEFKDETLLRIIHLLEKVALC